MSNVFGAEHSVIVGTFQIELEFRNVGFRDKNLGARTNTSNKLSEPGAHWWEASALTTAPSPASFPFPLRRSRTNPLYLTVIYKSNRFITARTFALCLKWRVFLNVVSSKTENCTLCAGVTRSSSLLSFSNISRDRCHSLVFIDWP